MRNIQSPESLGREADELYELVVSMSDHRSLRDPIASNCDLLLTHTQIHAVLYLGREERLTMGDLARRLGVTEKTVTGIVDRLEREGFLARERDAADRRVVWARLTAKGLEAHAKIEADVKRHIGGALALLRPAERRDVFRILRNLRDRLKPKLEGRDKRAAGDNP